MADPARTDVERFELVLIREEGIVQARCIGRGEQGDVAALDEALVHQLVDLHAVVHVTDPVLFHAAVVLQYQQALHLGVPQRVEQGGRTAATPPWEQHFTAVWKYL